MIKLLEKIDYPTFSIVAVLLLLVPFYPMPHSIEKVRMLFNGTLERPIDIFDLFMHWTPTLLLAVKIARDLVKRRAD